MQVFLEAIRFNHDKTFQSTGAFNLRRNEKDTVSDPEWKRKVSVKPEDSPAGYALDGIKDIDIAIQAKFSCSDPSKTSLTVKALVGPPKTGSGHAPNVLGGTGETEVVLTRGQSAYQTFLLKNAELRLAGVGLNDISWQWQYMDQDHPGHWIDFELSHHRIYTVISRPKRPWEADSSEPSNTQRPWTDVLDHACAWAAGARLVDEAATRIALAVNSLGSRGVVTYDNPNSGAVNFTYESPFMFDCSDFLRLLNGRRNKNGRGVNCDDCTAIVVSFANIVGCDLNEGQMGTSAFRPRRHLRIGLPGTFMGQFAHHTAGWKGGCTETEEVFDACVQLDSGSDSRVAPKWFVPTNIIFGQVEDHVYRFHLATDPAECQPDRVPRRRRIGRPNSSNDPDSIKKFSELSATNPFIAAYLFGKECLLTWRLIGFGFIGTDDALYLSQSFWSHESGPDASIGIDAYECASIEQAREMMNTILSTFQLTEIVNQKHADFGNVVFAVPSNFAIVFVRNRFVFRFRNTGVRPVPCDDFARLVDQLLLSLS